MGGLHLSRPWLTVDKVLTVPSQTPESDIRRCQQPRAKGCFTLPALVGVVTYERLTRSQDPIKHCHRQSLPKGMRAWLPTHRQTETD